MTITVGMLDFLKTVDLQNKPQMSGIRKRPTTLLGMDRGGIISLVLWLLMIPIWRPVSILMTLCKRNSQSQLISICSQTASRPTGQNMKAKKTKWTSRCTMSLWPDLLQEVNTRMNPCTQRAGSSTPASRPVVSKRITKQSTLSMILTNTTMWHRIQSIAENAWLSSIRSSTFKTWIWRIITNGIYRNNTTQQIRKIKNRYCLQRSYH